MAEDRTETIEHARRPTEPSPVVPGLVLAFGPGAPRRRALPAGGLQLGRGAVVFGDPLADRRMSSRHAVVRPRGSGWEIEDRGSRNGTWVDGRRITGPTPLRPGAALRLGDAVLVFAHLPASPVDDPDILGFSEAIDAARRGVASVGPHPHAVLLQGDTGTGKEIVARALHRRSGRRGPLVAVNCAAVAEGVFESELFGHERGAFTGAGERTRGLVRDADRGTLFLDEIAELPLAQQGKLLRVLETGAVRPVGGTREVPVDVRVVAATHADLVARVRDGRFRADLFARIARWTLALPALRDRPEDVGVLARHLLDRDGAAERQIAPELGLALLAHPWPLNVRGLRNVLTTALIASPSGPVALTPQVEQALATYAALVPDRAADVAPAVPPDVETLRDALNRHRGRVAAVARELGASRQQVYRWLASYNLDAAGFRAP